MPLKTAFLRIVRAIALLTLFAPFSHAIILLETGDPARHTSNPGDNHGWQYEGTFGGFLGTPIAPLYFLSAKHIGNQGPLVFHGETYTVVAGYPDPASDLHLWKVNHAFPAYAPLFTGSGGGETGKELFVTGRGTQRGTERFYGNELRGWDWGAGDGVQRWGRNLVTATPTYDTASYIVANFDNPGVADEAHLSVGDSGGGLFVQENGLWKLAAINYSVDDLYLAPDPNTGFVSAVFDARGFYAQNDNGSFTLLAGDSPVPTSFYSTRVADRLTWIQGVIGAAPATIPLESFAAWQTLYFTPAQRADAAQSGPAADPDGDGVSNLLEYAFNLDPTFPEPATMTAGTGLRGLPLIRLESVGSDQRLTVEFVRRTAASGAGLTYAAQFATDLAAADWQTSGTETVTPLNARWERVKVTDSAAAGAVRRFARVLVSAQAPNDE